MSNQDEDLERVKKATEGLMEHFDSVMIFCTRHEAGELDGTINVRYGSGNWFARFGQVREWLLKEEEASRIQKKQDLDG